MLANWLARCWGNCARINCQAAYLSCTNFSLGSNKPRLNHSYDFYLLMISYCLKLPNQGHANWLRTNFFQKELSFINIRWNWGCGSLAEPTRQGPASAGHQHLKSIPCPFASSKSGAFTSRHLHSLIRVPYRAYSCAGQTNSIFHCRITTQILGPYDKPNRSGTRLRLAYSPAWVHGYQKNVLTEKPPCLHRANWDTKKLRVLKFLYIPAQNYTS